MGGHGWLIGDSMAERVEEGGEVGDKGEGGEDWLEAMVIQCRDGLATVCAQSELKVDQRCEEVSHANPSTHHRIQAQACLVDNCTHAGELNLPPF